MRPSEVIGNWIGRRLAEVVMFLRNKPFLPSNIDWYSHNVEALRGPTERDYEILAEWRFDKRAVGPSHTFDTDDCCTRDCDCIATDTLGEIRDTLGTS